MPPQKLKPISHENLGDRVAAEVLRLIAAGEVPPGERLPSERRLAEMLEVSRVSVRAGLQKLKAQGLLSAVRGGGTRVAEPISTGDPALAALAQIDRGSLTDLLEIRTLLEGWAVRRAAASASDEDIALIREQFARMEDPSEDKAQADVDFHMAIAKASQSTVYRHLLGVIRSTLMEMLHYHRFELFGQPEDDATVMEQHRTIMEAIATRDPELAEQRMKAHLDWVRGHYIEAGLVT